MATATETSDAARAGRPAKSRLQLTLLLAACTGLAPFAMQAVAPATPTIAAGFAVGQSAAQLFVSIAMAAAAVGAVVYGPIADRFGRRPVLLTCLALSVVGSAIVIAATTIEAALFGRVLQSIGAGAGMILSRAVARDLFGQTDAATMISRITAAMVLAPMIAPLVGGALTEAFGWRAIFAAIAILSALLFVWSWSRFDETLKEPTTRLDISSSLSAYRRIGAQPAFLAPALLSSSAISAFFIFVGGAPILAEARFGLGPTGYGAAFAVVALGYLVGNLGSPVVARRLGGARGAMVLGGVVAAWSCIVGALPYLLGADGPYWFFAAAAACSVGAGFAQPQAMAAAVSAAPERAGSASSLVSVLQFGLAAVAAQAASLLPPDRPDALLGVMAGLGVLGLAAFWSLERVAAR